MQDDEIFVLPTPGKVPGNEFVETATELKVFLLANDACDFTLD